jgi:hypothetical protein
MNFEEGIEKLKQRQERLDRVVEETLAMRRNNDRRFAEGGSGPTEFDRRLAHVLETIASLSQKAQARARRPDAPGNFPL